MFLKLRPPSSPFDPPSLLYSFLSSPLIFMLHHTHEFLLSLRGSCNTLPRSTCIRLVCISDTHTFKPPITSSATRTEDVALPPGDVLIHAGDLSNDGSFSAVQDQISWLSSLPYEHKLVIAGNHDSYLDPRSRHSKDHHKSIQWGSVHYLQHSSLTLRFPQRGRSLNFYGAPQIPMCGGPDFAFQYQRGEDAWSNTIPLVTDVLITHTPPKFHLDLPNALGCEWLLKEIWKTRPRVHVFGHVHAGYGKQRVWWDGAQRAYERLRGRRKIWLIADFMDIRNWIDGLQLLTVGILGVLWSRIWGGEEAGSILVNAALLYNNSGNLGNPPTVVDI